MLAEGTTAKRRTSTSGSQTVARGEGETKDGGRARARDGGVDVEEGKGKIEDVDERLSGCAVPTPTGGPKRSAKS